MRELASFASSEGGKAYARIERYWGRDPAAAIESMDDVLAHNLRAAFLVTLSEDEASEADNATERARAGGAAIRERIG